MWPCCDWLDGCSLACVRCRGAISAVLPFCSELALSASSGVVVFLQTYFYIDAHDLYYGGVLRPRKKDLASRSFLVNLICKMMDQTRTNFSDLFFNITTNVACASIHNTVFLFMDWAQVIVLLLDNPFHSIGLSKNHVRFQPMLMDNPFHSIGLSNNHVRFQPMLSSDRWCRRFLSGRAKATFTGA